jgi:hypothetical protein
MKVVPDCNILVMCLSSKSPYHFIYQSLIKGKFNRLWRKSPVSGAGLTCARALLNS